MSLNAPADSTMATIKSFDGEFPDLPDVLESLDRSFVDVLDAIPYRFNFEGGEYGFEICDGYMYDCGNWIETDEADVVFVPAQQHRIDIIHDEGGALENKTGIGYMRVELDFQVAPN